MFAFENVKVYPFMSCLTSVKKIKSFIFCGIFFFITILGTSGQNLDRIVAIIGEEVILESDVENQYNYSVINGQKDDGTLRCQMMESLIVSKLLLNKAEQDSIIVSEGEVDSEIGRRIEYIMAQLDNDEAEFVKRYGKSVMEFREDLKPDIEDELLTQRQEQTVLSEATVTPREVKQFFREIPIDSLGLFPAEVQLNHIVIKPPYSEESVEEVKERLSEYRRQSMEGESDFGDLAKRYSEGPSARNGGALGEFGRGVMTPKFEAVVYNMRVGDISEPFETEFGFHIAKLDNRQGELLTVSHILLKPRQSANGDSVAINRLNEIREIIEDSLSFEAAAIRFSQDRRSKDCGGCYTHPRTGELRIPMDALDADLFFKIDEMEEEEISKPMEYTMDDGTRAFHVIYLKSKLPPHKPNLKDDYKKIHDSALRMKQAEIFDSWLEDAKKNIYIEIKPTECANALKKWVQ